MPLFMDFHNDLSVSVEEIKRAHIADEAVQSKYGVIYHQFWVNEENGTVFCLMEGPDKESCAAVHREAHGAVACSIVEVAAGFYKVFMGSGHVIDQGHVKRPDGTKDLGIRNVLVINIHGFTTITRPRQYAALKLPLVPKQVALTIISRYNGREVKWLTDDTLVAVFDSAESAVQCAVDIQNQFLDRKNKNENGAWNILFNMGLCAGQPVTEDGDFFSEATISARRLCNTANDNELVISSYLKNFCDLEGLTKACFQPHLLRVLNKPEETFITKLYSISEEKLSDESFTVDFLCRDIGMSRPQLYRKIVLLTGKSPINFIRDLRMNKALTLIKKKEANICEIALEVGYNNPSYFAKCFHEKYGCTPSRFAEISS